MQQPIATVSDLVFEYPGFRALHDVNFSLKPGSVTALVGPNGAGKTTLLRCLAALELPFSGVVKIAGEDTQNNPRACHEKLGYLSDFFGLYEELTVSQCLIYAANSRKVPKELSAERIDYVLKLVGLQDHIEKTASTLSRGLRQRLAIGQSIIHLPQLLLLDEPAAGLDPEARHELAKLIRELQAKGTTIIVSSHILAELEEYSTEMMIIRDGKILDYQPLKHFQADLNQNISTIRRIKLSKSDEKFAAILQEFPGLTVIQVKNDSADVMLTSGDSAAELLQHLVKSNLLVTEYHQLDQSMEELYLERVSRES
jgi:ABC-2 type transport system ATP-binding protein